VLVVMNNLLGKEFGRLVVVSRAGSEKTGGVSYATWIVRCKCGSGDFPVRGTNLTRGRTRSCGCLKAANILLTLRNEVLWQYKQNAAKRHNVWELDSQFDVLIGAVCHYCGDPPTNRKSRRGREFRYNGIDRKDNTAGYVEWNVVSCCGPCNKAKGTMSHDEFISLAEKVVRQRVQNCNTVTTS